MNKTLTSVLVVLGLLVGFGGGFLAFHSSQSLGGVSISSYSALDQVRLQNELALIAGPTSGWLASSTTMNTATVSSTTSQTVTLTVTGATPSDYLEWSESTSTANALLGCTISAANTVICTKNDAIPASTTVSAVTSTIYVLDLPRATFVSPVGL